MELRGIALADSVTIQSGYAVLFTKNQRKAIDSTPLKEGKFYFKGVRNNDYTIFVIPDKRMYPGYLPTFYKDKQNWKMADYITLNDSTQTVEVHLLKCIQVEGNGKINSRIQYQNDDLKDSTFISNGTYIENKSRIDSSACNIPVKLFDNSQKAISWTLTDDNGFYSFEKVLAGTYTILAETPIASAVSRVSLIDETNTMDINLMLKSTENTTATINSIVPSLNIYPNPVDEYCHLDVPHNGIISIYSISGQMLIQQAVNTGLNTLNLRQLKAGLYLLKSDEGVFKLRKL